MFVCLILIFWLLKVSTAVDIYHKVAPHHQNHYWSHSLLTDLPFSLMLLQAFPHTVFNDLFILYIEGCLSSVPNPPIASHCN